jgi:hypothetical protein
MLGGHLRPAFDLRGFFAEEETVGFPKEAVAGQFRNCDS